MNSIGRGLRVFMATVMVSSLLQLGTVVASSSAQADGFAVTATTWVNIRSGPGTRYSKLGILYKGQSVKKLGRHGVWAKVKYNNRTAYIHSYYLSTRVMGARKISAGPTGTRYSVAELNVRTNSTLSSQVVTTVDPYTKFTLTGRISNHFSEVIYKGKKRWVWTNYITSATPRMGSKSFSRSSKLPKVTGKMKLTGRLLIRNDDTPNFIAFGKLPKGSIIDVTGVKRNGVVQAIYQGQVRWFDADWVVPISNSHKNPNKPLAPAAIGIRYSKSNLNVRASASVHSTILSEAKAGTHFHVTGKIKDGYAQIIWQGRPAWVAALYLQSTNNSLLTLWSKGLDDLLPNGKRIVKVVHKEFPRVKVMYGVRFDTFPDHPSGKAVDIMLPGNYRNNTEYGWQMAKYMRANAKRLKIRYIIFNQHVWNVKYADRGWRRMSDRGNDTANHKDHVHVTTY